MDLYRQKYLKYKEKYLTLKNQLGGDFTIEFDEIINMHPVLSNIKDAFYSYCYLFRTSIEKENDKICSKDFPKINCSLIDKIEFEITGCNKNDRICKVKILKDEKLNNIVVCFEHGDTLFCPYLSIELLNNLINIYEKIQEFKDYNKFILLGHSMGASMVILFSYVIMIIEKSILDETYKFQKKYFDFYSDCSIPPKNIPSFIKDETKKKGILDRHNKEQQEFINELKENSENEIEKIKYIIERSKKKDYLCIHSKIEICIGGGFPVLFRNTDLECFEEFLNFYDGKYIHFVNTVRNTHNEIIEYDPVMLNTWNDGTVWNNIMLTNFITYDLKTLKQINLNDLPEYFRHTIEPDNLYELIENFEHIHYYNSYSQNLKKFIKIIVL